MKLHNRLLSTFLAVILMMGALSSFTVFGVSAAETKAEEEENIMDEEAIQKKYTTTVFKTPEEKLASMTLVSHMTTKNTRFYVDTISGEVATMDIATGQILFSNPYDVASSVGSANTKQKILSQIVIQYLDNGTRKYLYSFEEAAMRSQITVLNTKKGVRVEYTIGREDTRKLVPHWISVENFEKFIKTPLAAVNEAGMISDWMHEKILNFYSRQDLDEQKTQKQKDQLIRDFPIVEKFPIYTLTGDASSSELNWIEDQIKSYCEDYTFEQMDADHEATGYVAKDEQYPVFKMALEYSLDENGALSVRLPCNGLRYDMSTYTLEYISVLPYMGAGNSKNAGQDYDGYNFYPDGAGSLFDFDQLNTAQELTVRGKVYGIDYAYHDIGNVTYQKAIRYPVYGTVSSETIHTISYSMPKYNADGRFTNSYETIVEPVSNTVATLEQLEEYVAKKVPADKNEKATLLPGTKTESYQRGYVAIIEEGESFAELATYHAGSTSDYNTMMNYFNPKPKDSYDVNDAMSVSGSGSTWTVVSDRKYSGSITIRYQTLIDETRGNEAKAADPSYKYYNSSWLGMAEAYRDHLVANGTLKKLSSDNLEENIPLYLETFGAVENIQQIATIPMNVMTPLTTFEDVWTMYTELSELGVSNVNFKLSGYANGGMANYTVPAKLKWEKAVGGADGFKELIEKAKAVSAEDGKNLGIFPDFNFAYIENNTMFDSTSLKKDAVKTIDNRYSSFRTYSATQQTYVSFFQLAVAPSRYSKFYNELLENYSQYDIKTMSVGTLGTALNSDFDEDEPYNREDSKKHTVQAFEDLKSAGYSLMTEGANAFTWGYVDHIINVDLDSSRYIKSSASVPFIGAVLHGYVQFAGTPFNEEGDTSYAILRAIENGAGMYFILSYQNTQLLKENEALSQYYSVRYDIWKDDMVEFYKQLNTALKDVQDKVIVKHQFLVGERVLNPDELRADLEEQLKKAEEEEKNKQYQIELDKVLTVADAWKNAEGVEKALQGILDDMILINKDDITAQYKQMYSMSFTFASKVENVKKAYDKMPPKPEEPDAEYDKMEAELKTMLNELESAMNSIKGGAAQVLAGYNALDRKYNTAVELMAELDKAYDIINNADIEAELKAQMLAKIPAYKAAAEAKMVLITAELTAFETENGVARDSIAAMASSIFEDTTTITGIRDNIILFFGEDAIFTEEDVLDAVPELGDDEDGEDDSEEIVFDKYKVDNNQIVVVTYGDRNDETFEKTAYKSFILNYNNFAVRVTFEGKSYTIPSGGYVVLYH